MRELDLDWDAIIELKTKGVVAQALRFGVVETRVPASTTPNGGGGGSQTPWGRCR